MGVFVRAAILCSLPALPVIAYIEHDKPAVMFACLLVCAFAGVMLDSWLIIGTLLGVAAGLVFQPTLRSGTIESQAWESARGLVFWIVGGVVAGFFIGAARERGATSSDKCVAQLPNEKLLQKKETETSS